VIVDAMRSGERPGAVRHVPEEALLASPRASTHAFGVGDALALARALGRAPARLELVGIEAGSAPYGELSPAVAAGVGEAIALVQTLVAQLWLQAQSRDS
jgi:hydrogenase maturation protease